ncbi:hypothetical protein T4B_8772 [Trichinella pseudospiralis]|uniref:Uncharacterized protein n=1 Tax=Trichinella pseudospiralis TaxID=6337 RepID=A0A0V1EB50_TRIPS|nr:hypothetical protein T4A_11770 [Trichinella pseudospiralis]KRZ14805.1 hypothetical protein T4B_8772 [Trichinella pseudospiralis]KRZ25988.1 hypothetical protein T4C_1627 [Trichinella pseudospiralis]
MTATSARTVDKLNRFHIGFAKAQKSAQPKAEQEQLTRRQYKQVSLRLLYNCCHTTSPLIL